MKKWEKLAADCISRRIYSLLENKYNIFVEEMKSKIENSFWGIFICKENEVTIICVNSLESVAEKAEDFYISIIDTFNNPKESEYDVINLDKKYILKNSYLNVSNYEKDPEILKYIPYDEFLNLYINYRCMLPGHEEQETNFLIHNELLSSFDIIQETLKDLGMMKLQNETFSITDAARLDLSYALVVAPDKMSNLTVLLRTDILNRFAQNLGPKYYIAPLNDVGVAFLLEPKNGLSVKEFVKLLRDFGPPVNYDEEKPVRKTYVFQTKTNSLKLV